MADLVTALVALLKADAGVAALAGTRVFGGELPEDETRHMPRYAVVLTPSGGTSLTADTFVEHDTQRVDAFSYGPTPQDADALRIAVSLAFRRARRKVWEQILVHWVKPAGGPISTRDPVLAWPRAFQPFQAFHALEPIT